MFGGSQNLSDKIIFCKLYPLFDDVLENLTLINLKDYNHNHEPGDIIIQYFTI